MGMHRRTFLATVPASLAVVCAARATQPGSAPPEGAPQPANGLPHPHYPQHDANLVRELVGASHGDEKKVREIVARFPSMANAAWDWGFGDWESPLGAAAHTGRRAIAEFLLEQGARMDIFAAAMLGRLDAVRALLTASPELARTRGPHGITLLAHARAGGEQAGEVAAYLATVPDADVPETDLPLAADEREPLLGRYLFGPEEVDRFDVKFTRQLHIIRPGHAPRPLRRTSATDFSPAGAPRVIVRFGDGQITIIDGGRELVAKRG
jgi:hypothetical protein